MRSIAPNLDFHMWKGPTHFLMMEKPAEFNELIRTFIAKNKLL
jgi:pimeloyl-ACP methyl ester carboxylesterase